MKNKIKTLYDAMIEENLLELEINSKDDFVSIKRKKPTTASISQPIKAPAVREQSPIVASHIKSQETQKQTDSGENVSNGDAIKSPISGIFYRSPSPSSPPFVNEGDIVEAGKVICIIEAMKVMNEIKAQSKVKILKICLENAKSVTNGQVIFEIEPQ